MLGAEAIPAALFFLLLFFIPRSPRWLMSQKKESIALSVLERCGAQNVDSEIREIKKSVDLEHHSKNEPFFSRSYRFPILLAIAIAAFNQLSGINTVLYYAPHIFKMAGQQRGVTCCNQSLWVGPCSCLPYWRCRLLIASVAGP